MSGTGIAATPRHSLRWPLHAFAPLGDRDGRDDLRDVAPQVLMIYGGRESIPMAAVENGATRFRMSGSSYWKARGITRTSSVQPSSS